MSRGWLGVEIQPVTPDLADSLGVKPDTGALVAKETAESPGRQGRRKGRRRHRGRRRRSRSPIPRELARRIAALGPEEDRVADADARRQGAEVRRDARRHAVRPRARGRRRRERPRPSDDAASGLAKLGLELEAAKGGGVKIVSVAPDSAASERGLEAGDVIVDAGGKEVSQPDRGRRGVRRRQERRAGRRCCCGSNPISRCASWRCR